MTNDYEQMLQDIYTSLLRPGDACVDVGAHIGRHTLPMASCVGPNGCIYAFEPIPSISAELRSKLSASPELRACVKLDNCALSDTVGEADFVFVRDNPGYSGLRPRHYDAPVKTENIRVHVKRLDDLAAGMRNIRYIKIDCEGAELKVLRGASELLFRDRPFVSFECGDASLESYDYDAGDIFDFWAARDYKVESIHREAMDRASFMAASAQQEFWDYFATPKAA